MFSDCVFVKHNLSGFNKAEVRRFTLSHPWVIGPSPNVVIKPTAITSTKGYCTLIKMQRRENSAAFPDQRLPKL
jgi:hypothetical protein